MKTLILAFFAIIIALISCKKESEIDDKFKYDHLVKRYYIDSLYTDTIYYYYDSSYELIKKVYYRFDKFGDSTVTFVEKLDNYYKMGEDYYYFDDLSYIVRKSSFGKTEEYEYNDLGQLEGIKINALNFSKFIYKEGILQLDTTVYSIEQGYVTKITYYEFCDTLNNDLNFSDIGLTNYGLKTKYLVKSRTVISQDNLGTLNDTMVYKMEYSISGNSFQVDYKAFEKGKEIEQFRMQKLTKRIK